MSCWQLHNRGVSSGVGWIYIYTYIHIYMYTYIYTCIHTYIHAYVHIYMYTYIYTCVHTYIHVYIHTNTKQHCITISCLAFQLGNYTCICQLYRHRYFICTYKVHTHTMLGTLCVTSTVLHNPSNTPYTHSLHTSTKNAHHVHTLYSDTVACAYINPPQPTDCL